MGRVFTGMVMVRGRGMYEKRLAWMGGNGAVMSG